MTIADLQAKMASEIDAAHQRGEQMWRDWANTAGIREARKGYPAAIDRLSQALAARLAVDEEVRVLKEAVATATDDAAWEAETNLVVEGNKTYLIITTVGDANVENSDGTVSRVPATIETRKPLLADEKRAYIAREAAKHPAVAAAAEQLRQAEWRQAEARNAITVAELGVSAAKYELQAAIAELQTQAAAHPRTS